MRHIDRILEAVDAHPYLSPTEKEVLRHRIEQRPTPHELFEARARLDEARA